MTAPRYARPIGLLWMARAVLGCYAALLVGVGAGMVARAHPDAFWWSACVAAWLILNLKYNLQ